MVVVLYTSVDTSSCDALQPQVVVMLYTSVDTNGCGALRFSGHRQL